MLALKYYKAGDMRLEEVEKPKAGEGEVVIKVAYASICGTDVEEYRFGPLWVNMDDPHPITGKKAPYVLGHEFSGYIDEVGPGCKRLKVGDRVAVHPILACGKCSNCKQGKNYICENIGCVGLHMDGGFEEYCLIQEKQVFKVPDNVDLRQAAIPEPIGFCINSFNMFNLDMGDDVVIFGAGGIGLICIQIAKAAGAKKVICVARREMRLEAARKMGADIVVDVDKEDYKKVIYEATEGKMADLVVEATGSVNVLDQAFEVSKAGGKIGLLSVFCEDAKFDFKKIVNSGRTVIGGVAHNPVHFQTALQMLADGRVNVEPLISAEVDLKDSLDLGFDEYIKNKNKYIKMLIKPLDE